MEQAITEQFPHMENSFLAQSVLVYFLKQRAYWYRGGEGEHEGTPQNYAQLFPFMSLSNSTG